MSALLVSDTIETWGDSKYDKAYEYYKQHEALHWLPEEVNLADDVADFNKANKEEKAGITNILKLFTQNDIEVGSGYDVMLRIFKPTKVKMMLRSNANREGVHIDAYSQLTDTLGFSQDFYKEFLDVSIMKNKVDYLEKAKVKKYEEYADEYDTLFCDPNKLEEFVSYGSEKEYVENKYKRDIALMLAVYAALTEGVSLFAQFAMLLNYQLFNKYKGMCQMVTWSIRDEELHVQSNTWLFKQFIKENPEIWDDSLKKNIYGAARQIVRNEKSLLDYLYKHGEYTVDKEDMKRYIEYITDRRLLGIGLKGNFKVKNNPLPYMEDLLNTVELANFFEQRSTEYSKGLLQGSWSALKNDFML